MTSTNTEGTLHEAAGVQQYLEGTKFASHTVTSLSGGTSSFTYRLHLRENYAGASTAVLKHARAYAAFDRSFALHLERQNFEVEALKRVKAALDDHAVATVPTVYLFDESAHVIIMEDGGEHSTTLKELFLRSEVSLPLAQEIGTELGKFARRMHEYGRKDEGMREFFAQNEQAKTISSIITYGRLVSTLSGTNAPPALADPPLNLPSSQLKVIAEVAERRQEEIMTNRDAFVMGDFWPGNIIVALKKTPLGQEKQLERIFTVDWELAKTGVPGLDVGQFCAEAYTAGCFLAPGKEAASIVMRRFLEAYRGDGASDLEFARVTVVHVGTHLALWTPTTVWDASKEARRAVAEEGVRLIVEGWQASDEWLKESMIAPLVSND